MSTIPAPESAGHVKLPEDFPTGIDLLHTPLYNRGTGFTAAERDAFDLRGLLPPRVLTIETQADRIMTNLRRKADDLDKYVALIDLEDRNETLFYRVLVDNLEELMPIVYTPVVGQACQQYGNLFRRPRGLYISSEDRGRVAALLDNWPLKDVRVIVVTDGERILGLGDLGANGMGIPVGKLSLYTACAGIPPTLTLPIIIDVGTENDALRESAFYIGLDQPRVRGAAYDELIEEFMVAVADRFPDALIQFEDFANQNAFRLLSQYRSSYRVFNDDIQGTAAVTLAGLLAAQRLIASDGGPDADLRDQRILFLGAGEAGVGIADLVVSAMVDLGLSEAEARSRCWFIDSSGLVVTGRERMADHKRPYAHEHPPLEDLLDCVNAIRPTALIGVSGQPQTFTEPVLRAMAAINERPIIFALSNPTSMSECTAEQAYAATSGRAIFASGSPFPPVQLGGRQYFPGQGNNAYVFPGVGLGVVVSGARHITDEMFAVAARTLAGQVTQEDMAAGRIYPTIDRIRLVSAAIATAVADLAFERGLATVDKPSDTAAYVKSFMFEPTYTQLV